MQPSRFPVLFIPHGGGPLPLLGDSKHQKMNVFLQGLAARLPKPNAIVLISAHWEEPVATITSARNPELIYDYYGFPESAYKLKYPAAGNPDLADKISQLLTANQIENRLDQQRGFDHGMFVPLTLIYPLADIPCVQLSLTNNLDPQQHIDIGKALSGLREQNILIIGSGFSFHNMKEFSRTSQPTAENQAFEQWLLNSCHLVESEQTEQALVNWQDAPHARYCHPREEHLLPLMVCFGAAYSQAQIIFEDIVIGKKVSGFRWD